MFLILVFHTSCGQSQTEVKENIINSETKGVITSHGPGSLVRAVIQDKKGNIWFGAGDGLWRYDGSTFTKVSQTSALFIIEDKKGNIRTGSVGELYVMMESPCPIKNPP